MHDHISGTFLTIASPPANDVEAHRARLRAAKQWRNSLFLRAVRLIPSTLRACSFKSPQGSAARRQTVEELAIFSGGALDTEHVVRVFLKSPQGSAARRQTVEELAISSGGARDTERVVRVFLNCDRSVHGRRAGRNQNRRHRPLRLRQSRVGPERMNLLLCKLRLRTLARDHDRLTGSIHLDRMLQGRFNRQNEQLL